MWLERGVDGSVPLTKPEDPEEVSFRHNQFNSGKVPSRGYHKTESFRSRYQHENGKSTNYPWYFKNCRILCVLFLLVFLAIIALIRANIPLNATKIQTSISNELMGPTAGPYYHIDVSAFVGKLQGISNEYISHLESLGVKSVIISQVLEFDDSSAKGVVNFEKVHVEYGDQRTFTDLVSRLKEKGIKVMLQFIPNQTSIQHDWFRNPAVRDNYYVTMDASQDSSWSSLSTPNDAGSAWSEVPVNEDILFLHQFTTGEPDLNYRNSDVIREINGALEFWYSLGLDGFLLSKVSHLIEDLNELNNQSAMVNQPSNAIVLKQILNSSSWNFTGSNGEKRNPPFALTELSGIDLQQTPSFYSETTAVVSNSLADLDANFTAQDLRKAIENTMSVTPHNPVHWRVGSLTSRSSAKFGKERSQALTLVAALLPGQLVLNYGDEVELSTGGSYQELNLDDPSVKFFKQTLKASIALTMSQTQAREYVTPEDKPGIFVMNRVNENNFIVVANFGAEQASVPLEIYKGEGTTKVVVATPNAGIAVDENITTGEIQLPPDSAVALEIRNARK